MAGAVTMAKLLRRVDAARLEVMLEPEVLLRLMVEHGHGEEELRERIGRGATPGELLLALLEHHDADALWATLSPRVRARAEAPESCFTKRTLAALVLGVLGSTWAAMTILDPQNPHEAVAVPLCWVATSASGALLLGRAAAVRGALAGLLGGVGVAAVAWLATGWFEGLPSRSELLALLLVGAAPGVALGLYFARGPRARGAPREF